MLALTIALVSAIPSLVALKTISFHKNVVSEGLPKAGDGWSAAVEFSPAEEHVSNFAQLTVMTNSAVSDDEQMYGAGYAEAYITAELIYQHYNNMLCQVDCTGYVPPELELFMDTQLAWTREQVSLHPDCNYWKFIGSLLRQYDGIVDGYAESEFGQANPLSSWAFAMINGIGDLFDIIPATSKAKRPNFHTMTYHETQRYFLRNGHCSAVLAVTGDLNELYFGHTSWFTYSAMLRIYKTYNFGLNNIANSASSVVFSSYPGMLSSLDDFYMMGESKLAMIQTTNSIYNATLWDLVVPESLLAWQRVRAANQLATTGPQWYSLVSKYNSGTYNNQYMVLDGKLFQPSNALQPNTLFVIEQIPGFVQGSDVTNQLEKGYWGSYNVPYHQDIYEMSGYIAVDTKAGHLPYTEYQQAPRAKIFRRDTHDVTSLETLQHLLQYNEFQTDPYAEGSPWGAISARGDLDSDPYAGGGYDTKASSWSMLLKLQASIINGPTAQDQVPFQWSTSGLTDSHLGQPDIFDFEFELVESKQSL